MCMLTRLARLNTGNRSPLLNSLSSLDEQFCDSSRDQRIDGSHYFHRLDHCDGLVHLDLLPDRDQQVRNHASRRCGYAAGGLGRGSGSSNATISGDPVYITLPRE